MENYKGGRPGMEQRENLAGIPLFTDLSVEELAQMRQRISPRDFKKGEIILHEEQTNEFMYLILEGKVKVVQISEDGKETILALHAAGDFFGEMSLIDGKTVPATVIATENSHVAVVSKTDFYDLFLSHKKIVTRLLGIFCSRIRESYERIQILSFNNASARLKTLFAMLSDMYGIKTEKGVKIDIRLTHQNIADMTGITRETVTRILNKWSKDGDLTLSERFMYLSPEFLKKDFSAIEK